MSIENNTAKSLVTFSETICKNSGTGGWTCVIWPGSVEFFNTRGLVKIRGTVDGEPLQTSFMALGTGQHMLPLKASLLKKINKKVGDSVTITIEERL